MNCNVALRRKKFAATSRRYKREKNSGTRGLHRFNRASIIGGDTYSRLHQVSGQKKMIYLFWIIGAYRAMELISVNKSFALLLDELGLGKTRIVFSCKGESTEKLEALLEAEVYPQNQLRETICKAERRWTLLTKGTKPWQSRNSRGPFPVEEISNGRILLTGFAGSGEWRFW